VRPRQEAQSQNYLMQELADAIDDEEEEDGLL